MQTTFRGGPACCGAAPKYQIEQFTKWLCQLTDKQAHNIIFIMCTSATSLTVKTTITSARCSL